MKRGPIRRKSPSITPPTRSEERGIVLLDVAPLRKQAAQDCKRAMTKLEKARADLLRFETEDRPAFVRWLNSTLGELLTQLRENARVIRDQEDLIEEVELEMLWSNHRNPRRAYAEVMRRRENPEEYDDWESDFAAGNSADSSQKGASENADLMKELKEQGARMTKEERRAMFAEMVWEASGQRPEQFPKGDFEQMFADFEANFFEHAEQETFSNEPTREFDFDIKPPAKEADARIKEIYRILVRRLHPDLRKDGKSAVSTIWHDVQEAYEARNLERLETLLALTEMQEGMNESSASLGQLHGIVKELKRALAAVQRSISTAKHEPAWAFTKAKSHTVLEKTIRKTMERDLASQQFAMADMKRTLDAWSRAWKPAARGRGNAR